MELEQSTGTRGGTAWRFSLALVLSWMICVLLATGLLWSMVNIRQDLRVRLTRVELRERNLELEMLELRKQLAYIQDSKDVRASIMSDDLVDIEEPSEMLYKDLTHQRTNDVRLHDRKTISSFQKQMGGPGGLQHQNEDKNNENREQPISEEQLIVRERRDTLKKLISTEEGSNIEKSTTMDFNNRKISATRRQWKFKSTLSEPDATIFGGRKDYVSENSQKVPQKRSQRTGVVWITKNNPIARELLNKNPMVAKNPFSQTSFSKGAKKSHVSRNGFEDDEDLNAGSGCDSCNDIRHDMEAWVGKVNIQIQELKTTVSRPKLQWKCRNTTTEWNTTYNIGVSKFLATHILTCGKNEFLQSIRLKGNTDEFFPLYRYEYRCCSFKIE